MYGARAVRRSAALGALLIVLAGCQLGGHHTAGPRPTITTTVIHTESPKPTKTIVRNYQTLQVGQTGQLISQSQGAGLYMLIGKPTVSHTSLSTTHGLTPEFGNYLTFKVTIRNVGQTPILIQRLDFFIRTQGVKKTTTDDGHSPISGSDSQLDTTQLQAGQQISNFLTFDVADTTRTFFYAPRGKKSLAWTF